MFLGRTGMGRKRSRMPCTVEVSRAVVRERQEYSPDMRRTSGKTREGCRRTDWSRRKREKDAHLWQRAVFCRGAGSGAWPCSATERHAWCAGGEGWADGKARPSSLLSRASLSMRKIDVHLQPRRHVRVGPSPCPAACFPPSLPSTPPRATCNACLPATTGPSTTFAARMAAPGILPATTPRAPQPAAFSVPGMLRHASSAFHSSPPSGIQPPRTSKSPWLAQYVPCLLPPSTYLPRLLSPARLDRRTALLRLSCLCTPATPQNVCTADYACWHALEHVIYQR